MRFLIYTMLLFSVLSCKIEPAEIQYGFDQCHFCQMTIVDKTHAAILVSEKGRSEKFDAIECMVRFYNDQEADKYAMILVSDYWSPGTLIDAKSSSFIISKAIPSPMGAFLSALSDKETAEAVLSENGGEHFTWIELTEKFK